MLPVQVLVPVLVLVLVLVPVLTLAIPLHQMSFMVGGNNCEHVNWFFSGQFDTFPEWEGQGSHPF